MNPRKPNRRTSVRPGGFTLIELLIVIIIIALLVAILTPAVLTAMKAGENVKAQARIAGLAQGAESFCQEKRHYPGQGAEGLNGLMGSQKLAVDLWGAGLPSSPDEKYAQCRYDADPRKSDVYDPYLVSPNICSANKPNSISDRFGTRPMALLYFPAHKTQVGTNQFSANDNAAYLVENGKPEDAFDSWYGSTFAQYITTAAAKLRDRFIIIGAGMDRKYGTADDLTNCPK